MKYLIPLSFFLFILQVPPALNSAIVVLMYASMMLTVVLCVQYVGVNKLVECIKANKWVIFYAAIITISIFRSGHPSATFFSSATKILQIWTFLVYAISISTYTARWSVNKSVLLVIILPNVGLAITNIILTTAGYSFFPSPIEDLQFHNVAIVLSTFGIDMERVQYALARGFGVYSSYTGLIAVMAFVLMLYSKRDKAIILFSTIIVYIILLTVDSRTAIFYPVFISVLLFTQRTFGVTTIRPNFYIAFSLVGPLVYYFLVPLISSIGAFDLIARSSNDIQTGNSRFIIWAFSLQEFLVIKVQHIIGYGDHGHYISGASISYSSIFNAHNESYLKTPHNSFLSVLFDSGYIGLTIYILMFISLSINVYKHRKLEPLAYQLGACVIMYHFLCSITETLSGFYHTNYYYILSLTLLIIQSKVNERRKSA